MLGRFDRLNYRIGLLKLRFTKIFSENIGESIWNYRYHIVTQKRFRTMNRPRLVSNNCWHFTLKVYCNGALWRFWMFFLLKQTLLTQFKLKYAFNQNRTWSATGTAIYTCTIFWKGFLSELILVQSLKQVRNCLVPTSSLHKTYMVWLIWRHLV